MLTIFKDRSYDIADYPNSYALYANELSLPVYPQLGIAECQFIADTVKEAVMEVTGDSSVLPMKSNNNYIPARSSADLLSGYSMCGFL